MKLKQLSYPAQKRYTIPYLPHMFYLGTFALLCTLIPINIALAGSDIVTTLRSDPTTVVKPWWAPPFWPQALTLRIPEICQPQSINNDPMLRTNSTVPIFKYALRTASGPGGESDDPSQRMYPVPYMANPLSGCKVENIIWRVEVPLRAMTYKVKIGCKLGGQKDYDNFRVPDHIRLSTVYYRIRNQDLGLDDMRDYLSFNGALGLGGPDQATENALEALKHLPADSTSPNNILAVLDGMQADLLHAIWTQLNLWALGDRDRQDTYVVEWFAGSGNRCVERLLPNITAIQCGDAADPNRMIRWYGTTNDWTLLNGTASFLRPFNATILNMFIALQDAIMIDLGSADPASNIFLNKTYFNQVIKPDPFHKASEASMLNTTDDWNLTSENYWRFCSTWSCLNTSWAQALWETPEDVPVRNVMLPYKPSDQGPSVFSFSYLCPTFKRKSLNSLILSVFVATVSTLSALYGLFCYVMPVVEENYQQRRQAMRNAINVNSERQESYHPVARDDVYDHLPDSPGTAVDKSEAYNYGFTPTKSANESVDNIRGYYPLEHEPHQMSLDERHVTVRSPVSTEGKSFTL